MRRPNQRKRKAIGFAYVHKGTDFQISFLDFKSSNILLDKDWNAKLSDFGKQRLGPIDGLSCLNSYCRNNGLCNP
uniref:Protein kinase domain-containing protein n=1 Tax=Kalanchoe fedtschenkoi TaxID=63787 RepID=A0A7N0TJY5_KALFE